MMTSLKTLMTSISERSTGRHEGRNNQRVGKESHSLTNIPMQEKNDVFVLHITYKQKKAQRHGKDGSLKWL